jgi:hypothetical protein
MEMRTTASKMAAGLAAAALALALAAAAALALPASAAASPDYHQRSNWMLRPAHPTHKVDVFYVYPSAYSRADGGPTVGPVTDKDMRKKARLASTRQAAAFEPFADIYAPYYRQADAVAALSMLPAQRARLIGGIPAGCVIDAFDYYIRHLNRGRPFILAGHSQGSQVLEFLLGRYMKTHPEVHARMIAAYVVGYSVTPTYLLNHPWLKFTKGPHDTGVIISWNTEAPTIAAPNPVVLPGGVSVNPITWKRGEAEATAAQSLGSIELDLSTGGKPVVNPDGSIKRFTGLADARVDKARGVVVCGSIDATKPPYFIPGGFPMGVLHTFDYPLYFFDVRANARDRVQHYFAQED